MKSRALALAAALLVVTTAACTAGDDTGAPDATGRVSGGASGDAGGGADASRGPSDQAAAGPLALGGERALCVDLEVNELRDVTYGRSLDEIAAPVELRSVSLVGARQVQAVEAWVIPSDGVQMVETWSGWPLPQDERARLDWERRVPLEGARLEAGDSYNLLVRTLRGTGRGAQGFDAIEVAYEADGEEHVVRDDISMEFRRGC